jgi:hypothetical protein
MDSDADTTARNGPEPWATIVSGVIGGGTVVSADALKASNAAKAARASRWAAERMVSRQGYRVNG